MAKSGLKHIDVGNELTKTEWESQESHELIHGTSFPASPAERQLFYRDDEHKWHIYNGSAWVDLQATGGGVTDHGDLTGLGDDDHPQYIKHSLATAVNNFLVASGAGVFVKKTLAEVKSLLNWAADIATHAAVTTNVHGIQDVPLFSTATKTYYIDAVSGDDSNGGESSDDAFKTWGKAASMIPCFILHSYTIRIIGNMAEDVDLRGRVVSGSAILVIRGHTDTPGSHQVNGITLKSLLGDFRVQYLQATNLIDMKACSSAHIQAMYKLEPRCPAATADFAIYAVGGFVYFYECDFGTDVVNDCIYIDGAHLVSRDNTGNGQRYGLHARGGGAIGKKNGQPTGTTANELAADGGVIR